VTQITLVGLTRERLPNCYLVVLVPVNLGEAVTVTVPVAVGLDPAIRVGEAAS
jgi:hypothetical protein